MDIFVSIAELSSDYAMHFTKSGTTDYVIMKGPTKDLSQVYKLFHLKDKIT